MRAYGLLFGLMAAACGPGEPPRLDRYPSEVPLLHQRMPSLIGTSTAVEHYGVALERWRTSTTAYARGDVGLATSGFVELAYGLLARRNDPPEHAGAIRAARCLAYENVAAAWMNAGQPVAARYALRAASSRDADCEHSIANARRRLDNAP